MEERSTSAGWRRIAGVTLAGVVLAAAGWSVLSRLRTPEVATLTAESREVVRTLVVTGRVRPPVRSGLGMSASGVVREVRVEEGDSVARGEVLVRLDDRESRALVAQAEARLTEVVASAADQLRRAELELEQARRDAERVRSVFEEGGLTLQRVEVARQREADAESRVVALRAGTEDGGPTAAVAEARAALEAARARLATHVLTAPFGGTLLARSVEPGDAVQPGRVLLELAASGPTELVAFPAEDNLGRLAVGARARVSADAYPSDTFQATVVLVAPAVDTDQGTVEIRMSMNDAPDYLRPGMTVSVNLEVERREADVTLPVSAVRGLATDAPWAALVRDGRVERVDVRLGAVGDTFVEIVSGLEGGARVVRMADQVEPGDRVRPFDEG